MSSDRTKWGRVRFGGRRMPAMAFSAPVGAIVAALLGAVVGLWAPALGLPVDGGSSPLLIAVIFAICFFPPATLAVYVIVVDRKTMEGAADRPEESIESRWYDKAAAGAQTDVTALAGIAAVVVTLLPVEVIGEARPAVLIALVAVIAASFLSFAVRYAVLRKRG